MNKRKLFLLFFSAMTLSVIVMVIIYGLFIKDIDFTFNVKNPESAPSPIDAFREDTGSVSEDEDAGKPVQVKTPEESAVVKSEEGKGAPQEAASPTDAAKPAEPGNSDQEADIVPLEPQVGGQQDDEVVPPTPQEPSGMPEPPGSLQDNGQAGNSTSRKPDDNSIHTVYIDGFSSKEAARIAAQQLQERKLAAQPYIRQHRGEVVLQFGVFSDRQHADVLAQQLRSQNLTVKVE